MSFLSLDRPALSRLVHEFYGEVRADPVLGPVFNNAIGDHWDEHMERLTDFWSTVMLGTKEFQGNVFGTHMQLQGVAPEHFRRWLELIVAGLPGILIRTMHPAVPDRTPYMLCPLRLCAVSLRTP